MIMQNQWTELQALFFALRIINWLHFRCYIYIENKISTNYEAHVPTNKLKL